MQGRSRWIEQGCYTLSPEAAKMQLNLMYAYTYYYIQPLNMYVGWAAQ